MASAGCTSTQTTTKFYIGIGTKTLFAQMDFILLVSTLSWLEITSCQVKAASWLKYNQQSTIFLI